MAVSDKKTPRILVMSSLFPPHVIGGAEMSAYSAAVMLSKNEFEVGVYSCAKSKDDETNAEMNGMLRIWRRTLPRPYQIVEFPTAPGLFKPIWHIQDHFDPRNISQFRKVLDDFKPDLIHIHFLQGLGYNCLREVARRDIPCVFFLHDLGLACIRMCMFRDGVDCEMHCSLCKVSTGFKAKAIASIRRLGFVSPSKANLDRLSEYLPIGGYPAEVILNPNEYPKATQERLPSEILRFLFVGRLHSSKGIELLLKVAAKLAEKFKFELTIVGNGPLYIPLVSEYGTSSWCKFVGFVQQTEVSNYMINSDLLCIPSIWLENSPGVAIHALSIGLPVLGSRKGGIPELVQDGVTGKLINAGCERSWTDALTELLLNKSQVDVWRENALKHTGMFDVENIGKSIISFTKRIADM